MCAQKLRPFPRYYSVSLIISVLIWLAGCATAQKTDVSGFELAESIQVGNQPTIVDVRSTEEFNAGHIPGAIHIPFWSVLSRYDQIPSKPDQPVIIYCEHGPRATISKLLLKMVGFEHIIYLEGDMVSWRQNHLPIQKPAGP